MTDSINDNVKAASLIARLEQKIDDLSEKLDIALEAFEDAVIRIEDAGRDAATSTDF